MNTLPRTSHLVGMDPKQPYPYTLEHVCVEPEAFERLRAAAKPADATLNDVLLGGLHQAVFKRLAEAAAPTR